MPSQTQIAKEKRRGERRANREHAAITSLQSPESQSSVLGGSAAVYTASGPTSSDLRQNISRRTLEFVESQARMHMNEQISNTAQQEHIVEAGPVTFQSYLRQAFEYETLRVTPNPFVENVLIPYLEYRRLHSQGGPSNVGDIMTWIARADFLAETMEMAGSDSYILHRDVASLDLLMRFFDPLYEVMSEWNDEKVIMLLVLLRSIPKWFNTFISPPTRQMPSQNTCLSGNRGANHTHDQPMTLSDHEQWRHDSAVFSGHGDGLALAQLEQGEPFPDL